MAKKRLTIREFDEGEFTLFGEAGDFTALTHTVTPDLAHCGVLEIIDRYLRPGSQNVDGRIKMGGVAISCTNSSNKVVGGAHLVPNANPLVNHQIRLDGLAVHRCQREKGIGDALFRISLLLANRNGFKTLSLTATKQAKNLYMRHSPSQVIGPAMIFDTTKPPIF